jgi:hypothetical protein
MSLITKTHTPYTEPPLGSTIRPYNKLILTFKKILNQRELSTTTCIFYPVFGYIMPYEVPCFSQEKITIFNRAYLDSSLGVIPPS